MKKISRNIFVTPLRFCFSFWIVAMAFFLVLSSGTVQAKRVKERKADANGQEIVAETTPENDIARFLAGLPVWEGSPLAGLQKSRSYARHRDGMAGLWRIYQYHFFTPICKSLI